MEQNRVEELERLLAEAIPRVVIRDSKNEQISLSRYRLDLAAARESYHPRLPFLLYDIELEIQAPNVQAQALDLIRTELEPYIRDGKIHSATMAFIGGSVDGSPMEDILANVLRKAIVDGPAAAAQAFAKCATGTFCTYYNYRVLTGIRISQEVDFFQGIKLIPLPNSVDSLPAHIPPLLGHRPGGPRVEDLLSKTLLRVELKVSPIFHMPSQVYTFEDGPDKHFQISVNSEEVPDFNPLAFCNALSLETSCNIHSESGWDALGFYEIFNLASSVGGFRWSPDDLKETKYREVSDSDLEEAKSLYKRLTEIPQATREALRVPMDRWTKSTGQRDPADRMIDLGIALESLYLNDRGLQGELGFRLAMRAAWHLGKDKAHRAKLMKDFRKIYDWRSRAVHSGNLEVKKDKKDKVASDPTKRNEFISHAQELCSESIKTIIIEGSMPDWDAIVLGSS